MNKNTSTIIFDFDGTLADSLQVAMKLLNQMAHELEFNQVEEQDINKMRDLTVMQLLRHLGISMYKVPAIVRKMRQQMGRQILDAELVPGIREALETLKQDGHKLGIVTSNTHSNVHSYLDHYELDHFDFVNTDRGLFGKGRCLKQLLHPQQPSYYVGDEIRDIEAAKQSGMRSIAVTWGFNSRRILSEYSPDHIVDSPRELVALLAI